MDSQEHTTTEVVADDTTQVSDAIDYKAELEAAQKQQAATQKKLEQAEFTLKKQNTERKPAFDPEELDRLLDEKLDARLESKLSAVRAADTVGDVDDEIALLSDNPQEREYMRFIYDNKIVKSGFSRSQIREDLKDVKVLANAKKIQKQNTELAAALVANASMGTASMGSSVAQTEQKVDYTKFLSAFDLKYMREQNWSEEKIKQAAEQIRAEKQRN